MQAKILWIPPKYKHRRDGSEYWHSQEIKSSLSLVFCHVDEHVTHGELLNKQALDGQ